MPKAAFKEMWEKLKQGHSWRGMVKNLCKDGRYYWVDAFVTPIYEHGQLVGYQSVRTKPSEQLKTRAMALYTKINNGKSVASFRENISLRQTLSSVLLVAGIVALALTTSWIVALAAAALIAALFVLNYDELIVTPSHLKQQRAEFDSVSRYVYSGSHPFSIATYNQQMLFAKLRVLGRIKDSTYSFKDIATNLDKQSSLTEQGGIAAQGHRLSDIAAAMTQNEYNYW